MVRYFILGLLVLLPLGSAFTDGSPFTEKLGPYADGDGLATDLRPLPEDVGPSYEDDGAPTLKLGPYADGDG